MSTPLTLTLDENTSSRLLAAAAERRMSAEAVARIAVSAFLDLEGEDYELDRHAVEQIEAGLREAEQGEFASDEEVERIFDKHRRR